MADGKEEVYQDSVPLYAPCSPGAVLSSPVCETGVLRGGGRDLLAGSVAASHDGYTCVYLCPYLWGDGRKEGKALGRGGRAGYGRRYRSVRKLYLCQSVFLPGGEYLSCAGCGGGDLRCHQCAGTRGHGGIPAGADPACAPVLPCDLYALWQRGDHGKVVLPPSA